MQNLISLSLSTNDLAVLDSALATVERILSHGVALTTQQRRDLYKRGDKSAAFCRQTLTLLSNNPQVVPPSLSVTEALADQQVLDALRPRLDTLHQLTERMEDTEMALGSDVMGAALEGYALLKVAGKNQGLESLRRDLGSRFAKSPRVVAAPTPPGQHPLSEPA